MVKTHIKPNLDGTLGVTPEQAHWTYLSFAVQNLNNAVFEGTSGPNEVAMVPQQGQLKVSVNGESFDLSRQGVFEELPHVLYLPPDTAFQASGTGTFAWGGAPAEGKLPARLFHPSEMRVEMRGGANATRQVSHLLGPDLPAERLLLYEVYTPSGNWSGWPPHRHDGKLSSQYMEETYYYRVQPEHGWAIHRNYSPEDDYDEALIARDGDLILSRRGYHPVAAAPGSNVYYLNFMAGEAVGDMRTTLPVDEAHWAWMRQDWGGRALKLPLGLESSQPPYLGDEIRAEREEEQRPSARGIGHPAHSRPVG